MPTSDDVMQLAEACAARVDLPRRRRYPSFAEVEEQCPEEYEDLLGYIHEDELYAPADSDRQEDLVRTIRSRCPSTCRRSSTSSSTTRRRRCGCSRRARFTSASPSVCGWRSCRRPSRRRRRARTRTKTTSFRRTGCGLAVADSGSTSVPAEFSNRAALTFIGRPGRRLRGAKHPFRATESHIFRGSRRRSILYSRRASALGIDLSASATTTTVCRRPDSRESGSGRQS